MDAEFLLLKKLLKLDARNFHGWDYRRFVAKTKGVAVEDELLFTTDKINENFSNYSAWHNRSALLSEISKNEAAENGRVQERLQEEYELVKNSFYTDPDDQSGWFYYSWLLGQTIAPVGTHVSGCWPPPKSLIVIDLKNNSYKLPFNKLKVGKLETLPVVICFSNSVTGVNDQTVSTTVDGNDSLELEWRPVERWQKSGRKWTTNIKNCLSSSSGQTSVKILVGAVPGITSLDGQACERSWQSSFQVLFEETSSFEDYADKYDQLCESILQSRSRTFVDSPSSLQYLFPVANHSGSNNEEADGTKIWQLGLLDREIQSCRELLDLEENSKWTRLTLTRLLLTHASYNTSSLKSHIDEARKHLEMLKCLDPTHQEYYQHQLSLLSLKELTMDEFILAGKYVREGLLKLNQLSLCSLEFADRFLWVQNLDLSHNQLRSTHGLEALQLLSNLTLSHNRIGSVTALAPLRGLPLLEDVDVSYNQIGDHTVDTCRVLCSSKLINASLVPPASSQKSDRAEWHLKEGRYWEIKVVFEDLCWQKLNIAGNSAAKDVEFVDALNRALNGTRLITEAETNL
nr:geranylgeranyl transferase type-2 subunit alpha 1-like isoform X2 [Physcomitrium patens]|eukprot:XP_024390415.1 geranylgeranyl transferase type-2 subunit alpha 1-like isoform X2 [Physcomitrella patens]